jgi:hypothetical protein
VRISQPLIAREAAWSSFRGLSDKGLNRRQSTYQFGRGGSLESGRVVFGQTCMVAVISR